MKNTKGKKVILKETSMGFVLLFFVSLLISQVVDQFWIIAPTATPSMISFKSIIVNILSTIACACGVSAVWEIYCKQSFTKEVLTLNKMAESCYENGIEYVYSDYNDIDWYYELDNIEKLTILFCYGYTWRNHNRALLRKFVADGGILNIYLPNYENEKLIDELDRRFEYGVYCATHDKTSTKDKIIEAYTDFQKIGANVFFFDRTLCSLYFVMDKKAIFVPYRHCKKMITYPAIRVNNRGCMYEFINQDLDNLELSKKPIHC